MRQETTTSTSTARTAKKILIVTGDLPSHPYACVKLAIVLAECHHVTVAGPNGSALSRLQAETQRYNNHESTLSTSTSAKNEKKKIGCISIGDVSTVVHGNVRRVINPQNYSPIQIIFNTIFNCKGSYNPYGMANDFEQMTEDQMGTYDNLKQIIIPNNNYDLVITIHTAAGNVCDAIESLQQQQQQEEEEGAGNASSSVPPCIVFSSLPYNPGFFYKNLWKTPRSIVALPHVATYSSPSKILQESKSKFFLDGLFIGKYYKYLIQIFWMWLDTYHAERAWRIASKRCDERRVGRGLPPVHDAGRYYWRNYPVLCLGGVKPFFIAEEEEEPTIIADNATVVGSIRSSSSSSADDDDDGKNSDLHRLDDWFHRTKVDKIVYASFGTGTQLSVEETINLAKLALSLMTTKHRLLLSLSKDSQERSRHVFDKVLGSEPTKMGDGFCEYNAGLFRIDDDIPQESLLVSKKVKVEIFVSHMGFGGYTEAVYGGVPFVAYPAGCDQWYNTERAVEAGVAVRAKPQMKDLNATVREAIENESMKRRSQQLALDMEKFGSNNIILEMVDDVCNVCNGAQLQPPTPQAPMNQIMKKDR